MRLRYEVYQNLDGWYFLVDSASDDYERFLKAKSAYCQIIASFMEKEIALLLIKLLNNQD